MAKVSKKKAEQKARSKSSRPKPRKKAAPRGRVLGRIQSLKDAVQSAIDNGATSVQEVHARVAAMPFDQLARIAVLEGLVERARSLHDQSVGAVYDTVRAINARVGELADAALRRIGQGSGA